MLPANRKAKLLWQSRRGMIELDLVLNAFIGNYLDELTLEEVDSFEELLSHDDPEIFDWLVGASKPKEVRLDKLVQRLRSIQISLSDAT